MERRKENGDLCVGEVMVIWRRGGAMLMEEEKEEGLEFSI